MTIILIYYFCKNNWEVYTISSRNWYQEWFNHFIF